MKLYSPDSAPDGFTVEGVLQLNYNNAYARQLRAKDGTMWLDLVSYCTPVAATDLTHLYVTTDANCTATTRKHLSLWVKHYTKNYDYSIIKKAIIAANYKSGAICVDCPHADIPLASTPLGYYMYYSPCKTFSNGSSTIMRGDYKWSRLTC